MKTLKTLFILFNLIILTSQALTLETSSQSLFNVAEDLYPDIFSPINQPTQKFERWLYRYYPETKNYIGINDKERVFLLGEITNQELQEIGGLYKLTRALEQDLPKDKIDKLISSGDTKQCKQLPLGKEGKILELHVKGVREANSLLNQSGLDDFIESTEKLPFLFMSSLTITDSLLSLNFHITKQELKIEFGYKNKKINDTLFNELEINDSHLLLPLNWCQEMSWRTALDSIIYTSHILAMNEPVLLFDGKSRNAIKVEFIIFASNVRLKEDIFSIFTWFDIEYGYPIKIKIDTDTVNKKELSPFEPLEIISASIMDIDKNKDYDTFLIPIPVG